MSDRKTDASPTRVDAAQSRDSGATPGDAALEDVRTAEGNIEVVYDLGKAAPRSLVVDNTYLYWTENGANGPLIRRAPKSGGSTILDLASWSNGQALTFMAADRGRLYWLDGDAVVNVSATGGTVTRVPLGRSDEWAALTVADGKVMIAGQGCRWFATLPVDAVDAQLLKTIDNDVAGPQQGTTELCADGSTLYCANAANIFRVDLAKGVVVTLSRDQGSAGGIVKVGDDLFWLDGDPGTPLLPLRLKTMPSGGGTISERGSSGGGYAVPLFYDASLARLYWGGGNSNAGRITSYDLTTRSFTLVAEQRVTTSGFALDDDWLYWTEAHSIVRRRK